MNERIRELAKQARQIGEYVNYGQIQLSPWQFEQKFAELIVRECVDVLIDVLPDIVPDAKDGVHPVWHIKEHFDIE